MHAKIRSDLCGLALGVALMLAGGQRVQANNSATTFKKSLSSVPAPEIPATAASLEAQRAACLPWPVHQQQQHPAFPGADGVAEDLPVTNAEPGADKAAGKCGLAHAIGAGDDQRFAFGPQDVFALPPYRRWRGGLVEDGPAAQYARVEGVDGLFAEAIDGLAVG